MLTFQHAKGRFNYRTAAAIVHSGRVLLHRAEAETFWTLPGGRVEFGEAAQDALVREMREELAVQARVERLLWVVENFFTYEAQPYHELAFYFLVALPHDSAVYAATSAFGGNEPGTTLIFEWHALASLPALELYPSFLRNGLQAPPAGTTYIVHHDG